MSIICPNLKNKEVAREFEELKNATSEAAAYHIWSLNNGNSIDKAPNGEPSKLFSDLLEHYNGDRVAAIQAKARTYSNSFRDWFGDWTNTIKPGNIIFGHPAIGKTYSLESGKYKDKLIDWDEEFNTKRDKWIEDHSNTVKGTPEYKKARNEYLIYPERHPDYVEFIKSEWERVKNKVKKEGKILFASPHNLLKMFPQDFNRIINLKDDDFIKRNIGRGGKEKESKLWKEGINETISNTTGIPVEYLNENQYFEDYLNKHLGISKVVDENGEPKLMFHGSDNVFDTFRNDVAIYTTDAMSTADSYFYSESNVNDRMELFEYTSEFENYGLEREGDYVRMEYLLNEYSSLEKPSSEYDNPYSNSPFFNNKFAYRPYKTADDFLHNVFPDFLNHIDNAEYRKEIINAYVEHEHPINPNDFYKRLISGQILPLFVSNKNPLVIDGKGSSWNEIEYNGKIWSTRDLEIFAKNNNYDGLIINNIIDLGGRQSMTSMDYGSATVAISYNPNQVKSIDNQGTFSTQDDNIYHNLSIVNGISDSTLFERLFKQKFTVSARTILDRINRSNPELKHLTDVLNKLTSDVLKDVKLEYKPVHLPNHNKEVAASYNPNTNTIVIFGDSIFKGKDGLADSTILHELVHAATVHALQLNPSSRISAQKLLDYARTAFEKKYGKSWKELSTSLEYKDVFYGLTNIDEFFAEAFANSSFIKELYQIESSKPIKNNSSFIKDLLNWIMGILSKLYKSKNNNLYNETMIELEHVMFIDNYQHEGFDEAAYEEAMRSLPEYYNVQKTSDEAKIKSILSNQKNHIAFESESHTYTNVDTGDVYTPVSVIKDLNGYGADIESMSDEDLAYGEYAAKVGTAIHDYIHSALTGEKTAPSEVKLADSAKKMIKNVVIPKIVKKGDKVIASEQIISNDAAKIAGTLDLLVKDSDGQIHLKDFKTKARVFKGKGKYGFDYYFSAKKETKKGGKPDASRHDYQLTLYKRMLELLGINIDHKEIIPLEYTVDENGVITEVWIPDLDYAQADGSIYHRTNNALEQEINQTVLTADANAITSDINSENLLRQSEIVSNILKVLKNQLAIYKVKGYTTKSEVIKKTIDELNSMEESEILVAYVKKSMDLLKPLIDEYNANLELERKGIQNIWNLRKLEAWKNYAQSFSNLEDIQNYLFLNPTALTGLSKKELSEFKESLATVVSYKNILENAYKSKGEKIWLDWLAPFSSRVEADYRLDAEKAYKKTNKGTDRLNDKVAMNRYIENYVSEHRNEIDLRSRELLRQQSKIATTSPLGMMSRMLDTVFESADPIVGAMARAYHTRWTESNMEFNNMYRDLISLTEELENAYPAFKSNPAKLYDFMIENDANGIRVISKLSPEFMVAYERAKKEINTNPKYETNKDKAVAIAGWLNENAPIEGKAELAREKTRVIDELLSSGKITAKEHMYLVRNEKKDQSLKRSWADLVYRKQITEDVADYLRQKFNELNWSHRKPLSSKYPNKKWNDLEKLRNTNPQDIRVRFFDFISDLSKHGDSFVPDRFKLNGRLPGMSKVLAERVVSEGVTSQLIEAVKKDFTLRADDTDKGMQMTDELDRPIKFVPIFFTNILPSSEQSLDVATIYKEWFRSVNNYKYINDILPQLEYTKWVIENRKTIKTDSEGNPIKNVLSKIINNGTNDIDPTTNALTTDENLIAQLNAWFDQVVYGISNKNLGTTFGLDKAKTLEMFQKYTSLKIMGLNTVSMINNALMAEVQQTMEAFANQYVSSSSYTRATGEYLADMPNILGDIGSRKITSLTNLLNEHFGVFTDFNEGSLLENNRLKKLGKISTLYFTTNVGEHEAQSRFLLASLIEKRALNKKGEDIGSMFDYFTVENGKLVFDKEHKVANFSKKDQIAFGQQVTAILRKMHGNYASYSKVALQQYSVGKLVLMFRKWIWTTGKRRWAKEYYDEYGQTFSKGYYRDGGAYYYNKIRGFFERFIDEAKALEYAEKADWDTMTEAEKANVKRFTTEICLFMALTVMGMLLNEYKPDDDDSVMAQVFNNLDYQIFRLSTDMTFYISPASFMKIVQSPLPSSSVLKNVSNFIEALFTPTARFEKGDWKGELKIKKRAMDLIPLVRQIYRLRNIEDEKQLLSIL